MILTSFLPARRAGLALLGALTLAASAAPASAQVFFRPFAYSFEGEWDGPGYAPGPWRERREPHRGSWWAQEEALGPGSIVAAARRQGYAAVSRPQRNRDVYVLEAQDGYGRRARLVLDAYDGAILQRFASRQTREPRAGRPPRHGYEQPLPRERDLSEGYRDEPRVIEGFGPTPDTRPDAPARRTQPPRSAAADPARRPPRPAPAPVAPRPEPAAPVERSRPAERPQAVAPSRPSTPQTDVKPVAPGRIEDGAAPGPIPPPPAPKAVQAAPAAPPPALLDEIKPAVKEAPKATPMPPPAGLE